MDKVGVEGLGFSIISRFSVTVQGLGLRFTAGSSICYQKGYVFLYPGLTEPVRRYGVGLGPPKSCAVLEGIQRRRSRSRWLESSLT